MFFIKYPNNHKYFIDYSTGKISQILRIFVKNIYSSGGTSLSSIFCTFPRFSLSFGFNPSFFVNEIVEISYKSC